MGRSSARAGAGAVEQVASARAVSSSARTPAGYGYPHRRRRACPAAGALCQAYALDTMSRLLRDIRAPRTYARILYLLLAFPIGLAEFVFLVVGISFGTSTVITLVGIPILVGMLFAWRWLAAGERRLIESLLDMPVRSPYRAVPARANWWERLRAYSADPATWKDLAFLGLRLPIGIVTFALALAVLTWGLGMLLLPAYAWAPGDWSDELGFFGDYPGCVLGRARRGAAAAGRHPGAQRAREAVPARSASSCWARTRIRS